MSDRMGEPLAPLTPLPSFAAWREASCLQVEETLDQWLQGQPSVQAQPPSACAPYAASQVTLLQAMRYGVLSGGKRLRALLVLATSLCVGGNATAALRAACAVELIHAYSLIHDDMPCMDNDVLRRGKPTVHVQFGQSQALLAGDALQCLAFELLVPGDEALSPTLQVALCRTLARASGLEGMAGGQAIDLLSVGQRLSPAQLQHMHQLKTGALLQASVRMGYQTYTHQAGRDAAATSEAAARQIERALPALEAYGAAIGLAFQVADDILDATAPAQTLGKTAGKDAAQNKPTYVSTLGLAASQRYAQTLLDQSLQALDASGLVSERTLYLRELATALVHRAF